PFLEADRADIESLAEELRYALVIRPRRLHGMPRIHLGHRRLSPIKKGHDGLFRCRELQNAARQLVLEVLDLVVDRDDLGFLCLVLDVDGAVNLHLLDARGLPLGERERGDLLLLELLKVLPLEVIREEIALHILGVALLLGSEARRELLPVLLY